MPSPRAARSSAKAMARRPSVSSAHASRRRPSRSAHAWTEPEGVDDPAVVLASIGARPTDAPLVVTPTATLRRPTPGEFAEHLGMTYRATPGSVVDLVVVGTGPAGLAASVYGA